MMSLRAVHAGSGYRYLLRSVATNDADPGTPAPRVGADNEPGSPDRLSAYYQAKGTPAGRWRGSGLGSLDSEFVAAGAEISEDQMAALYGEGLHPDADARMGDGESLKDVKLGRAFGVYTDGKPVLKALAAAEKDFRNTHDRRPDEAERSELARTVGWVHYADAHGGQEPTDSRQVLGWVNKVQDTTRQAVAGFDLTFSPVKSVSTLWALADEDTANTIATAHHKAVAEALSWVEDNAVFTRVGVNGIQQLSTTGIVASEFTHFDTRGGDPDLHSHVLVSNKVQIADTPDARKAGKVGQWKTLDSQQMFQHATSAGGVYNTALQHHLSEALGVEFTPVVKTTGKEPVWEIKGVPTALNEKFSSRRTLAKPLYEQMVADYVSTHHRQPSRRANYELWQAAILETRDAKKPAESLDTLRAQWREAAQEVISPEQIDGLVARVRNAESTRVLASDDHIRPLAQQSIEVVLGRRATFKRTHLHTSVSQLLHGYRFTDAAHHQRVYNQVMDTALNQMSVCLTPPETLALPDALTAEAGHGIDRKNNAEVYTTAEHLERERAVLHAADTPAPAFVESHKLNAALHRFTESRGFSLNVGQQKMAEHFLTTGTQLAVAVGPAGTGKTTSMEVVTDLWQAEGRQVVGLAPSAAAAKVLQGDIGANSYTIDSLTYIWNLEDNATLSPTERLSKLPVQLNVNDMLLVDEAGMAATDRLASLVEIAEASGAVIRMVGDPAQLDAVETGGIFRTLTRHPTTPVLTDVMRMGSDTEQATATLAIRDGNVDGLALYFDRDWVRDGTREEMITDAVNNALADMDAGLNSMVIAPTNADVGVMNEMIQAHHIDTGRISPEAATGPTITLSDGLQAHVGDTVLARKNTLLADPEAPGDVPGDEVGHASGPGTGVRVLNGQTMTVRAIHADGSLAAYDPDSGQKIHLPADYLSTHTQLGYAATVNRSQGATVDTTHSLVDAKLDRNALYVATTRGKQENRLYVDTTTRLDESAEDAHMHHSGDEDAPTAESILHGCVHHDHSQRSAVDELRQQLLDADSPERITALYREGVARATNQYAQHTTAELLDSLPVLHATAITAELDGIDGTDGGDGTQPIENAISYAAAKGVDARDFLLPAADDIDWADSPARLIGSRIRGLVDAHLEVDILLSDKLAARTPDGGTGADFSDLDPDQRFALDTALHSIQSRGLDVPTIWTSVNHGVANDENIAGVLATKLTTLCEHIDNPTDLLATWVDQLPDAHREQLGHPGIIDALAEDVADALRVGLDPHSIWQDAVTDTDFTDSPADEISDVFRQVTQHAQDTIDTRIANEQARTDHVEHSAEDAVDLLNENHAAIPDDTDHPTTRVTVPDVENETHLPAPPPVTAAADAELAAWLEDTYTLLTATHFAEDAEGTNAAAVDDPDIELPTVQADGIAELNRQYAQHWAGQFTDLLGPNYHISSENLGRLRSAVEAASAAGVVDIDDAMPGFTAAIKAGFTLGRDPVDFTVRSLETMIAEESTSTTPTIPVVPYGQDAELRRSVAANHGIDIDEWDRAIPLEAERISGTDDTASPGSLLSNTHQHSSPSWPSEWDRNDGLER